MRHDKTAQRKYDYHYQINLANIHKVNFSLSCLTSLHAELPLGIGESAVHDVTPHVMAETEIETPLKKESSQVRTIGVR